jgi:PadR family transcriptional regulator, regulatory protein PadR
MESSVRDLELTPALAALIRVFLLDADRPRFGFELMRLARQNSGTFYRNLAQLEQAGWITGGTEHIDKSAEPRPPRRFYRITRSAVFSAYPKLALLNANGKSEHSRRMSLIVEWPHSETRPDASHVSDD